jgi:uncharacterized damage-inducible protein DinB
MNKTDIELLCRYDRWANNRVITAAAALSTEQFIRNLGGSFPCVRDTLLHIIAGEWIWLQYWKLPVVTGATSTELRAQRDALFHPDKYPDLASVQSKWTEVEERQIAFVNGTTDELLNTAVSFRSTQATLAQLMQHMANHSTYHRGQISLMMRQLKAEPVATDFHVFLAEDR